nr:nucleotidyltransferase domain-containing protein [Candidatus Njordarchaeota archaeon]
MRLREGQILDLSSIVDVVSRIQSVVGVFLFGSFARGDYDEYSDYDLIVVFEDNDSMWRSWDGLFQAVGSLKMNLHVIPQTLKELKTANPVFLDELFKHGKVLYSRLPLRVFPEPLELESFYIVFYDMSRLNYRDKMRVSYFLYKKGGGGALARVKGVKLSEGCFLLPSEAGNEVIDMLSAFGVIAKKLQIYASGNDLKDWGRS